MLVLDAGNTLSSGSRQDLNQLSEGRITVEAMNLMGYDVLALGPYDFGLGVDVLRQRLAEGHFAAVSANSTVDGQALVEPYVILERGAGTKVAILGLTGPLNIPVENLEVTDAIQAALNHVPSLTAQADYVVVLSNLGPTGEAELAQTVAGISLIVGGGSGVAQNEVTWVGSTALVRAGGLGEYLGITQMGPEGVEFQSLALGPDVADDPELAALVARYQQQYNQASTVTPG